MCASCGCATPNDNHGDDRNITLDQLQGAAEAAKISLGEVGGNLTAAARQDDDAATTSSEPRSSASRLRW